MHDFTVEEVVNTSTSTTSKCKPISLQDIITSLTNMDKFVDSVRMRQEQGRIILRLTSMYFRKLS